MARSERSESDVMADLSLHEHVSGQISRLCDVAGLTGHREGAAELIGLLLGAAGENRIGVLSSWPSGVSDDTTPVEFSVAFDTNGKYAVRVLGETVGTFPEWHFLDSVADRLRLATDRFEAIRDLFLAGERQGEFRIWYSLIFRPDTPARLKVYLNPQVSGPSRAVDLVVEGMRRLGIERACAPVLASALTRGTLDRFSFFALDLDGTAQARVKLYVTHEAAEVADVVRAASLVAGIDPMRIQEFCAILGGGYGPFQGRPLISSYSFVGGDDDRPSSYGLYLPIRSYVPDDEVARARVLAVLAQYDMNSAILDESIAAVSARPLRAGVGLIPHISLRLGASGSGITVYLSSEAYSVMPPRGRSVLGLVSSAQ
ncbi:DMATS type aromatic prenyltransferase [Kibdelosporangium banguiense]|uniref:DMATS type aromatic prenyltransferase n=2 Tax=Kibdelosporangium banguiense TaxID=1365924 RepID=A0ABS4U0G1_9PSEU|nr:DMATS type aromatic prenyltransferase [Kibdelosporangium banguiense]